MIFYNDKIVGSLRVPIIRFPPISFLDAMPEENPARRLFLRDFPLYRHLLIENLLRGLYLKQIHTSVNYCFIGVQCSDFSKDDNGERI